MAAATPWIVGHGQPAPKPLPKSLRTVRILVAVARAQWEAHGLGGPMLTRDAYLMVKDAARIIGYADASETDPLLVAARRQLAGGGK